jgi:hypothetical protein
VLWRWSFMLERGRELQMLLVDGLGHSHSARSSIAAIPLLQDVCDKSKRSSCSFPHAGHPPVVSCEWSRGLRYTPAVCRACKPAQRTDTVSWKALKRAVTDYVSSRSRSSYLLAACSAVMLQNGLPRSIATCICQHSISDRLSMTPRCFTLPRYPSSVDQL